MIDYDDRPTARELAEEQDEIAEAALDFESMADHYRDEITDMEES